MLHLILGRSGSGKTMKIRQEIAACGKTEEGAVILLVPEQNSFESERALLMDLGAAGSHGVEVLSFTRLADRVFSETGGMAGQRLQESGRCFFMSAALQAVQDTLRLYARHASRADFVTAMLSLSDELKLGGITPEAFGETAIEVQGELAHKIEELARILKAYDALVGASCMDPRDDLMRLYERLCEVDFFAGRTVFIDSFKSFTGQEWKILERILVQAKEVWVALSAESASKREGGLFAPVNETARKLTGLAKRCGIPVAEPIRLTATPRFRNGALRRLEANLFRPGLPEKGETCGAVHLFEAADPFEEAAFVARTVHRLAREQGVRYRDIAVIARSADPWQGVLDAAFSSYGIPLFLDKRIELSAMPLSTAVLAGLEAVANGFVSDEIMRFAKSSFSGLSEVDTGELENYVLLWGISGKKWMDDFTAHPYGFAESFPPEAVKQLEKINSSRRKLVEPLQKLADDCKETDGKGIAGAVYRWLLALDAPARLRTVTEELRAEGEQDSAHVQAQLWDLLMEILDQVSAVFESSALTLPRFVELLHLAFAASDLGHIPQGLDTVSFGTADRMRPNVPKITFLLGANEGVFPQMGSSSGVLTDADRLLLADAGLSVSPPAAERAAEERLIAYMALTSPSDEVYVSYARQDVEGGVLLKSVIITELETIFPGLGVQTAGLQPELSFIESAKPAFEHTASMIKEPSVLAATLRAFFEVAPGYKQKMDALYRVAFEKPFQIADKNKAQALFGNRMRLSASRVETYYLCRFAYFCKYGLRMKPRRKAELDASEYGSVVHYVLERLLSAYGSKSLASVPQQELDEAIRKWLDAYVQTHMGGFEEKGERFRFLFDRLAKTVSRLAVHMAVELGQSEFTPADLEYSIDENSGMQPLRLQLPDGGELLIEGKIDRVDVMHKNNMAYVRVIDYKTGAKSFRLSDVLYGLNMQMLIYLITLWKNGADRYGSVLPAGLLYMPAQEPGVDLDRHADEEQLAGAMGKKLKMNGLVLDDRTAIEGMEPGIAGVFIPVKAKKDGELDPRVSSVASLSEFGKIAAQIERLLVRMAHTLREGNVAAVPAKGAGYNACEWCEFGVVCGYEKRKASRKISTLDLKDTLEVLKEGGERDGEYGMDR